MFFQACKQKLIQFFAIEVAEILLLLADKRHTLMI